LGGANKKRPPPHTPQSLCSPPPQKKTKHKNSLIPNNPSPPNETHKPKKQPQTKTTNYNPIETPAPNVAGGHGRGGRTTLTHPSLLPSPFLPGVWLGRLVGGVGGGGCARGVGGGWPTSPLTKNKKTQPHKLPTQKKQKKKKTKKNFFGWFWGVGRGWGVGNKTPKTKKKKSCPIPNVF